LSLPLGQLCMPQGSDNIVELCPSAPFWRPTGAVFKCFLFLFRYFNSSAQSIPIFDLCLCSLAVYIVLVKSWSVLLLPQELNLSLLFQHALPPATNHQCCGTSMIWLDQISDREVEWATVSDRLDCSQGVSKYAGSILHKWALTWPRLGDHGHDCGCDHDCEGGHNCGS